MTVRELLEKEVEKIISERYSCQCTKNAKSSKCIGRCKVDFVVSQIYEKATTLLTITHAGYSFSNYVGHETNLEELIMYLYNQTT